MSRTMQFNKWLSLCCALLLIAGTFAVQPALQAAAANDYVFLVREIDLFEPGLEASEGLAYSPQADVLLSLQGKPGQSGRTVAMINRIEQLVGTSEIGEQPSAPLNMAFNRRFNGLYIYEGNRQELLKVEVTDEGKLPSVAQVTDSDDMRGLGIQQVRGIDIAADGRLFFLDPPGKRMYIVTPNVAGDYSIMQANRDGRIVRVDLKGIGEKNLNGLAFNPISGNLFTLGKDRQMLYEIDVNGGLLASRDVSSFGMQDGQGMVFAPSGDATDLPEIMNLYMVDPGRNLIVEVSITPPESTIASAEVLPAASPISLVSPLRTYAWNPSSPDPVGLDYRPSKGSLLVVDSEVDEMAIFKNASMFESSRTGSLMSTCNALGVFNSNEPNGVAVNPANDFIYITDDGRDRIYEINPGGDRNICTGDDTIRAINTAHYGLSDTEGAAFGDGKLLISDGLNAEVYVITPGPNGVFDGAAGISSSGDDQMTSFDTTSLGLRDPEGLGFHPVNKTVFIVSRGDNLIVETTLTGSVRRTFAISFLNARSPGGLGLGPGSQNSSAINVYMTARGVDNNTDPNENDGMIYELNIGDTNGGGPQPTPTRTPTAPPQGDIRLYLSLVANGTGATSVARDEDIVLYDGSTYSLFFDGSDVGVTGDVDAFNVVDNNTILMSFDAAVTLSGVGTVDDHDIVEFTATSLGSTTAGSFNMWFDGEDVELTTSGEDIDALDLLPDGRLILSTRGGVSVTGASGTDEDLLMFTPTQLGSTTAGTWAMYFDGSDVGLNTTSDEDVDGVHIVSNGNIYLSTLGAFSVAGSSGTGTDIFVCTPASIGGNTSCTFSSNLYFQGSANGITGNNIDGFDF